MPTRLASGSGVGPALWDWWRGILTHGLKLIGFCFWLPCTRGAGEIVKKEIKPYNGKKDLYFIPNGGGTKTKDITKFNAFFIDLDCGRDENDEYFPIDIVDKYKEEQMRKLKSFHLKPNCIVSTRNGKIVQKNG